MPSNLTALDTRHLLFRVGTQATTDIRRNTKGADNLESKKKKAKRVALVRSDEV